MTYFTGIDVSLRSVSICIVDDKGEVCREAKIDAQVDVIAEWLRAFSSDLTSVGFEAGALSQYLTYGLQAAGFEVICLEARQVKSTLSAMRNKTDRNDARGIAQILRTGWYSRVHIKSLHSHRVRALLASRKVILKKCVDLENELRGLLRVFGTRLASRIGHGSFDAEVRETFAHDEMLSCALTPLLDARTMLYKTYVRSALYIAAHSLLTRNAQWSSLKAWGIRLAKTRGHRRAVIAVARKLAVILHRMWVDGSDFRWGQQPPEEEVTAA